METLSQLSDVAIRQRLGSADSRVRTFKGSPLKEATGTAIPNMRASFFFFFSRNVLGAPPMVTSHPGVLCENAKAVNHLRGMRKGIFKRTANSEHHSVFLKLKQNLENKV